MDLFHVVALACAVSLFGVVLVMMLLDRGRRGPKDNTTQDRDMAQEHDKVRPEQLACVWAWGRATKLDVQAFMVDGDDGQYLYVRGRSTGRMLLDASSRRCEPHGVAVSFVEIESSGWCGMKFTSEHDGE